MPGKTRPIQDCGASTAVAVYWASIYPQVRRELSIWDRYARAIPDPVLRSQAIGKLTRERLNPEAAAFFAITSLPEQRARIVRLIVAYQILYDYLDAVNEQPGCTSFQAGITLNLALVDAVMPSKSVCDYYRCCAHRDDGGYVAALMSVCRSALTATSAKSAVSPVLEKAARRCMQAQSYNHAVASEGDRGLRKWCVQEESGRGYLWWEVAAAGISCLAVHALFALATDPLVSTEEASTLDGAYFPAVCAISALLDSLVDAPDDALTANHSFAGRYGGSEQAAERLTAIANDARLGLDRLARPRAHSTILAGIVAFYLSSPSVDEGFAAPVAERVLSRAGSLARAMCAPMRLRRLGYEALSG